MHICFVSIVFIFLLNVLLTDLPQEAVAEVPKDKKPIEEKCEVQLICNSIGLKFS